MNTGINDYVSTGTFGKKKIYYKFFNNNSSKNFIFFHGLYSSSFHHPKYEYLTKAILNHNLGNVLVYETSRRVYSFETNPYADIENNFAGKTFHDELSDVLEILKYARNNFFKQSDTYNFVGFSLGGTLSSYCIPMFNENISNIFLFGSGITTKGYDRPITNTYPDEKIILSNFDAYTGNLLLIQGSDDLTVPLIPARKIITESKKPRMKELQILKGIDHTFTKIHGIKEPEKLHEMIFKIIKSHIEQ